jgi:hypothetical protein
MMQVVKYSTRNTNVFVIEVEGSIIDALGLQRKFAVHNGFGERQPSVQEEATHHSPSAVEHETWTKRVRKR